MQHRLDPLRLSIREGLMRYEDLAITIGGRRLAFDGVVDLAAKGFDLRTALPRDLFGGEVGEFLEGAGSSIDTERLTEVRLRKQAGGSVEVEAPGLGGEAVLGTIGATAAELARQRAQEQLEEIDLDLEGLLEGLEVLDELESVPDLGGLGGLLDRLKGPNSKKPKPAKPPKGP